MHERIQDGALTEVTLLVLLAVYEPNHGYGIMQYVSEKTNGRVQLGAGTLYGAINTLTKKGWITPVNTTDDRKKQVQITETGRRMVQKEYVRLQEMMELITSKEDRL